MSKAHQRERMNKSDPTRQRPVRPDVPSDTDTDSDMYALLVEMSAEAVLVHAADRIMVANHSAAMLLGAATPDGLLGRRASDFFRSTPVDSPATRQVAAYPRRRSVTMLVSRLDGSTQQLMIGERGCIYHGVPATQMVIRSASAARDMSASILESGSDPLTDLPNRRQFKVHLQAAIDRAVRNRHQVWVLYVDLDRFRDVNARHGHQAGDRLLYQAAVRLQQCVRKTDMVASPGGDEFLIALEGTTDLAGAGVVAQRALKSMVEPFVTENGSVQASACIGITAAPDDGVAPDDLLQNVDVAMWQAKAAGINNMVFFSPDMDAQLRRSARIRAEISSRLASLTPREQEVLEHLVAGEANKMIAYELGSSMRTIEHHRAKIMSKLQAGSLPELVRMVLGKGDL